MFQVVIGSSETGWAERAPRDVWVCPLYRPPWSPAQAQHTLVNGSGLILELELGSIGQSLYFICFIKRYLKILNREQLKDKRFF